MAEDKQSAMAPDLAELFVQQVQPKYPEWVIPPIKKHINLSMNRKANDFRRHYRLNRTKELRRKLVDDIRRRGRIPKQSTLNALNLSIPEVLQAWMQYKATPGIPPIADVRLQKLQVLLLNSV